MVILPDHLHAVWTLLAGDSDYATRWMLIKAGFSGKSPRAKYAIKAALAKANGESGNGDMENK